MTDPRRIIRINIEGGQGAGKTFTLKALAAYLRYHGAAILGMKLDSDSRDSLLVDMTAMSPAYMKSLALFTTKGGPLTAKDSDFASEGTDAHREIERQLGETDDRPRPFGYPGERIQFLQPAEPAGFLPFHDVLMRQIAAKVGVPFEGLGHSVPTEKDHRVVTKSPVLAMPYGGKPARRDVADAMAENMFGSAGDPQPGGVCGDGPGDASASGDIGIERGSYVAATIPVGADGRPIGEPVVTRVEAPTKLGDLSPPVVQERAMAAFVEATKFPSEGEIRAKLLQEIATQGLDYVIEEAIVARCIETFLAHGYEVMVYDDYDDEGQVAQDFTTNASLIRSVMRSTAGDRLILRHHDVTAASRRPWVSFVWGNGVDVIHDYSTTQTESPIAGMATMMAGIDSFVATIDERNRGAVA